ncbi:MAG: OmpA family protein [Rhodocyclaceae bacterium]|nr:OmpA family protein [Rhodocyclaceae bacterium]
MKAMVRWWRLAGALAWLALAACATRVELPETRFQQVRDVSRAISLEVAKRFSSPIPGLTLPQGLGLTKPLLLGGFPQASTAEAMVSGHHLRDLLLLDLRQTMPDTAVARLEEAGDLPSALMLHGVVSYLPGTSTENESSWFKIAYAVRTYPDADVLLSGSALVNARHFDATPTRFYKDAPIYFASEQQKELVALASAESGDAGMQRAMRRSLAYESARGAYEREQYEVAARRFEEILEQGDSEDLLALSGRFQSLWQLARKDEAEQVFGRLIDVAIARDALSIKFLFAVQQDDFDRRSPLYQQYPMWIRQVARGMLASRLCFEIKGHSSRSGTAAYNDALSTARARRVMRYMTAAEPELASRVRAKGYGFRQNIIGSGSDDAGDAIDRRVDFAEVGCPA